MARRVKETVFNWLLGAIATILVTALGYAVTTSWQNADRLARISGDLKSIKTSLVRISMKTSPNDPTIPIELLSSKGAKEGLQFFAAGDYPAAYAKWSSAAASGDQLSALSIGAARESLELKLKYDPLTPKERELVTSGIRSAPELKIVDGKYVVKNPE
ncbi:hypothetical protein [Lysobacter antibioticus]|uniref:hypothetical protein n=1 Tax=Lysobacter antibioticus TaxID=84531 RepID=UPI001269BA4A|nr:hypothetical protein [Lysobacter antibioticus]